MAYVATCVFREPVKTYYLDPGDLELHADSRIVAETARGLEIGRLKWQPREMDDAALKLPLQRILRLATAEDLARHESNLQWEEDALQIARDRVAYHDLPMKPIKCEAMLDRSRLYFFYESEARVDFRELLRDVASRLNVRLQFQQLNARETAQIIGGVGVCGQPLCCSTWLKEMPSISLKMAKDQGMSLTPSKISGMCGRLMCCLRYETDFYREQNLRLPTPGTPVDTPEGPGRVLDVNVFTEEVCVELGDGRRVTIAGETLRDIRTQRGPAKACKNHVNEGGSCDPQSGGSCDTSETGGCGGGCGTSDGKSKKGGGCGDCNGACVSKKKKAVREPVLV